MNATSSAGRRSFGDAGEPNRPPHLPAGVKTEACNRQRRCCRTLKSLGELAAAKFWLTALRTGEREGTGRDEAPDQVRDVACKTAQCRHFWFHVVMVRLPAPPLQFQLLDST